MVRLQTVTSNKANVRTSWLREKRNFVADRQNLVGADPPTIGSKNVGKLSKTRPRFGSNAPEDAPANLRWTDRDLRLIAAGAHDVSRELHLA